ncbi:MAG: transposase [Thermoplasmata archaeon]|nr:transposase [Thermoplasmata archaeon]
MKLILTSKEDIASMNIREEFLGMRDWQEAGTFDGNPVHRTGGFTMILIDDIHLYYDDLDRKVKDELGIEPDVIIVASRHRSESKLRTLTVHPLGNYSSADYGGRPGTLVPSAPREMTHALVTLARNARELDFKISFEATHHGPYNGSPLFFIEIGSDESAWPEKEPATAIAKTILSLDSELATGDDIVAMGIGGGHYMPRMSDVALEHKISFGHMVPGYATDSLDEAMIEQIMEKTPGVEGVYFHRKALSKPRLRELKAICEELGLEILSSKEMEFR